jgi:uncharacterized repeat protein (TIGR03987 family)
MQIAQGDLVTFQLLSAVILITLALVFYSIGVWSERLAGRLMGWHLAFFWAGFVCDTTGTGIMVEMSDADFFNIHGLTGLIAILLMFIHAVWASVVLARKDEKAIVNFHKFSVVVWVIWLIPYLNGFFVSMRR